MGCSKIDLINCLMTFVCRGLLVAVVLVAAGCETTRPRPVNPGAGTSDVPIHVNSTDSLEPGNHITITFSGLSTIPIPYVCRIREDGTISPPYLKNPVTAAGKTIGELERELEQAYVPDIYKTINVTIKTADRFFYVGGGRFGSPVARYLSAGSQLPRPSNPLATSPILRTKGRSG